MNIANELTPTIPQGVTITIHRPMGTNTIQIKATNWKREVIFELLDVPDLTYSEMVQKYKKDMEELRQLLNDESLFYE